jgi:hypothetical protein
MTRCIGTLLVAVVAFTLPGCSYLCRFEARGNVRDAAGKAIAGVKVELVDAEGHSVAGPAATDEQGTFMLSFQKSPTSAGEQTGWRLVLASEGFEEERIEVGTVKEPKNANETVYLIFHTVMRRKSG